MKLVHCHTTVYNWKRAYDHNYFSCIFAHVVEMYRSLEDRRYINKSWKIRGNFHSSASRAQIVGGGEDELHEWAR